MFKKRHLTLVYSNKERITKEKINKLQSLVEDIKFLFIPQNQKIESLRLILLNMYRDYEITSGQSEIPYFVRAENKINQIIQEGKINYYYKKLRRFQNYMKTV